MATVGLAVRNNEAIQAAVYSVVFSFTLVSSVFLPTQTMPGWLQAFACEPNNGKFGEARDPTSGYT